MRADARRDVKIAWRSAAHAGFAFAGDANALALFGARRNVDAHGLLAHHATGAAASGTGVRRSRLDTAAVAGLALGRPLDRERGLEAAHGVEEIEVHRRLDVVAALRSGASRASARPSEHPAQVAEDVTQILEV